MKCSTILWSVALLALLLAVAAPTTTAKDAIGATIHCEVGYGAPGPVVLVQPLPTDTPIYMENNDGTFENGYCWRSDGISDPYYGAFAEAFHGPAQVVAVRVYLSTLYEPPYRTSDVYIWGAGPDQPGAVLALRSGVGFDAIPLWPTIGAFDVDISAAVGPNFYVGSQADFGAFGPCDYFVAADVDGPGGSPWTCVAPGSGWEPTGWQDPTATFGETASMGYGVYLETSEGIEEPLLEPEVDRADTWGGIKTLFGE